MRAATTCFLQAETIQTATLERERWNTVKAVTIPSPYARVLIRALASWIMRGLSPLHISGLFLAKGTKPTAIHLSDRGSNVNEKLSASSFGHLLCTWSLLPSERDAME